MKLSSLILPMTLSALVVLAMVDDRFVLEYFGQKRVTKFVGFACDPKFGELLIKKFSKINISGTLANLTQLKRTLDVTNSRLGVYLDFGCYPDRSALLESFRIASASQFFTEIHCWLVKGSSLNQILDVLEDEAFGLSTDFVVAVPRAKILDFELFDIYNPGKESGGLINVTKLGYWSNSRGFQIILNQTKLQRRSNMHSMLLRASFYKSRYKKENESEANYLQGYTNKLDGLSKFGYQAMLNFISLYNFSFVMIKGTAWKKGDREGPIARALLEHKIDITGTPLVPSIERTYTMKNVLQARPFRITFFLRCPQPKNMKIGEITRPLDNEVWALIALTSFLIIIWFMITLIHGEYSGIFEKFSDSCLLMLGSLSQQATNINLYAWSVMLVYLNAMIFGLLIYNYYGASVVSARFSEPIFRINDSLNQLANTNVKVASEWMIYLDFFMSETDWETTMFREKKWNKLKDDEKFLDPREGIEKVREGGFAYNVHPNIGYPYIHRTFDNREICELAEVNLAKPTFSTIMVRKNCSYQELARIGYLKMAEVGLLKRLNVRFNTARPLCQPNILSASSIDIYEFSPHLLLLSFGLSGATVLFTCEFVFYNLCKCLRIIISRRK